MGHLEHGFRNNIMSQIKPLGPWFLKTGAKSMEIANFLSVWHIQLKFMVAQYFNLCHFDTFAIFQC